MKPRGVVFGVSPSGPTMTVTQPEPAEDAVWEAVQKARAAGWSVRRFRLAAAEAWESEMREEQEAASAEWRNSMSERDPTNLKEALEAEVGAEPTTTMGAPLDTNMPNNELPGMWDLSDFTGGAESAGGESPGPR